MSRRHVLILLVAFAVAIAGCTADKEPSEAQRETPPQLDAAEPFTPAEIPSPIELPTSGLVKVPDPLSGDNPRYPQQNVSLPSVGGVVRDSRLGTEFFRVTERAGARHEYSRFDPFNADKSMIVLYVDDSYYQVFRTEVPYEASANLVTQLDITEARWDRSDPDVLIGLNEFRILSLNVGTGASTLVKDFAQDRTIGPIIADESDLYRVTTKEEGEPSWDDRWWAFFLQGTEQDYRMRYAFVWDRATDAVVGLVEFEPGQSDIDWIGMSARGTWVILGGLPGNGAPFGGTVIANRELTEFHRIDFDIAHGDPGLDMDGNEVLVMQNTRTDYVDLLPLDPSTLPIMEPNGSYAGTNRVPLVRLYYDNSSPIGFDSGLHVSCNAPGWALISTHLPAGAPEKNWLDCSNVLVRLDAAKPETFFLSKIHNTTDEYWEETQATISNDGRSVVWGANFGMNPGRNQMYLMRLDLW